MQTEEPKLPVGEYGRDQVYINEIGKYAGQTVRVYGWVYNKRSSGKLAFLLVRDGTGVIQCVVSKRDVGDELFASAGRLTQESSLMVEGSVRADSRAPGGYELLVSNLKVYQEAGEYPITPKEHGVEFLMEHRHLWLRSSRQQAILKIRSEIIRAVRDYLDDHGFTLLDNPILTPAAAEGTTNLFKTDYFDQPAFLSQSGQLYNEANALAFGKVYCFGPTFRAEKSKTRRHLIEFWMVEPEMAYFTQEENMRVQEELVGYVVQQVLKNRPHELEAIERDTSQLEKIVPPFPRITYDEAIKLLQEKGHDIQWGNDFGAPDETAISENYEKPVFVTHFPTKAKAFYMEPDPIRPEVVLCADLLAPEGYGEIIGGSQRIADLDLLQQRIREHHLPEEVYQWYLDLRRYGSVPHSGFGMGIERVVAWVCKLPHVRETIPFPRLYDRIEM